MNFKLSIKKLAVLISACILFFFLLFFIILGLVNRKPIAAFYGISQENVENISKVLNSTHKRRNKKSEPYNILILDETKSLEYALKGQKKPDLLFLYNGENATYATKLAAKRKTGFSKDIVSNMPSSIQAIVPQTAEKITAIPLLLDNYEIAYHKEKAKSAQIKELITWQDVQTLASKTKSSTMAPIIFAAGDDIELINIMGALLESVSGKKAYDSVVEKIRANIKAGKVSVQSFYNLADELFAIDGEFYQTAQMLNEWKTYGLLPKNFLSMSVKDVRAFISSNDSINTIAIMSLSQHRRIERDFIAKYKSSYIPSILNERSFTAPIIMAVPLSKNKIVKKSLKSLAKELQGSLSNQTELAPTDKNASTPDRQADDARFFIAASNPPLAGLSQAFTTKGTRAAFAEAIRSKLR